MAHPVHFPAASAASAAAPAGVWALLVDGATWRQWYDGLDWAVFEGPPVAGGYVTLKPHRGRQTAYRIADARVPVLLAVELTVGPLATLRMTWTISPLGSGSTVEGGVEIVGPLSMLVRSMGARAAAAMPANLARLAALAKEKALPETGSANG